MRHTQLVQLGIRLVLKERKIRLGRRRHDFLGLGLGHSARCDLAPKRCIKLAIYHLGARVVGGCREDEINQKVVGEAVNKEKMR